MNIRKVTYTILFWLLTTGFFTTSLFAQDPAIKKSTETETIDGKKYYKHTVQKGETIYAIARTYSLEAKDIIFENPNTIDGVKPGQVLKIPFSKPKVKPEGTAKEQVSDTAKYSSHKVEQGQTLYSISKQYKVSIEVITAINPQIKDGLKSGQVIKIPVKQSPAAAVTGRPLEKTNTALPFDPTSLAAADIGEKKKEYNVALMLPFDFPGVEGIDMDEIRKGDAKFPARSMIAVEFYQGVMMAIDSLKKTGLSCKVFVYDVEEGDSVQNGVLKKPELKEMDLIIGPLFGSNFTGVAKFAKENKIPVVSPYLQQNKILFDNPYVSKMTPSNNAQLEQMAVFVADTFRKEKLFVVFSGAPKEAGMVKTFKAHVNDLLKKSASSVDSVTEVNSFAQLESLLSETKVNVISIPSSSPALASEYMGKLYRKRDKYKIVVAGLQNWTTFENLDIEYLNALQLHLPAVSYIDYENPETKKIIRMYRQKYATDPGAYVYQGYDVAGYYLKSLYEKGTGFSQQLSSLPYKGIQVNSSMFRPSASSGFENRSVFILKYNDYKLVKAN